MAQYFTDFTGESVGASPPTGWTARGDATAGWEVLTGPYAGYNTATFSNQYDFLTWDTVGSVTGDVEIVALMRFTNDSFPGGVAVHVQSGSVGGYPALFTFSGDAPAVWLVSAGSDSNIDADVGTYAVDTDYWIRLQRTGTTVRARFWADGAGEPGTWQSSGTDATHGSGYVGLFARNWPGTRTWKKVGVGTGGDAAPTSDPGGGGPTLDPITSCYPIGSI